jgi:hypothetical protein
VIPEPPTPKRLKPSANFCRKPGKKLFEHEKLSAGSFNDIPVELFRVNDVPQHHSGIVRDETLRCFIEPVTD